MTFRIATWNLDHASNSNRPKVGQVKKICEIAAQIFVLTETCSEIDLTPHGYNGHWSAPNEYGKHYSAIWSKWPILETIATCNPELASCAIIETSLGTLAVYGTIFTYRDYRGPSGNLKRWKDHLKDISAQGADWQRIRKSRKNCSLVVAGNFNQVRDGVGIYKSPEVLEALDLQLRQSDLVCVTQEDFGAGGKLSVDPKLGRYRHNIDHICLPKSDFAVVRVDAWDGFSVGEQPIVRLSDHNGVYVDISKSNV